jgi:small subunit ribosomal protein S20
VANIKSQIKRNKTNEIRHERNKAVRSELKTRLKNAIAAAQDGSADDTVVAGRLAQKRLDKAAAKGVIHKNAAARRNSRLAKRLNAAASASSDS